MNFNIEGLQFLSKSEVIDSLNNHEPGDILAYGLTLAEMAPSAEGTNHQIIEASWVNTLAACLCATSLKYGIYMDGKVSFTDALEAIEPEIENHNGYILFMTVTRDDE